MEIGESADVVVATSTDLRDPDYWTVESLNWK